jgi:hypothetical protein
MRGQARKVFACGVMKCEREAHGPLNVFCIAKFFAFHPTQLSIPFAWEEIQ